MSTKDLIIVFSILCVIVFVVFAIFFPVEESRRRKKRRLEATEVPLFQDEKKWQETAFRLKEYAVKYKQEVSDLKREEQRLKEKIKEEEQKAQKFEEKLKREKQWLAEQESSLDRRTKEMRNVKIDLTKAQTDREHEYSLRLAADREKKEIQADLEKMTKEKNELVLKVTNLEFLLRTQKEELVDLRKTNASLQKKKDDEQWIAKSEFDKLEMQLKQKEKEIQKLRDDGKR
jgi:hypothetical protein